ncbi:MAG: CBS domain-containing protein, partial [Clostridia bacterium]|nr:CBS domain-containing protein [Clostridia bacterium]
FRSGDVMKKPQPLITKRAGPAVALRIMKEHGISSVFVVDKEKRYQGIITVDMAVEAKKSRVLSLNEIELAQTDVVREDVPVQDTLAVIAESKLPMAVVNEENKLIGIIVRGSVLAALATEKGGESNE